MTGSTRGDDLSRTLLEHGVRTVVVIDNAVDLRVTEAVSQEGVRQFAEQAREDEELVRDLQANGIDLQAVLRREERALLELAARRDSLLAARPAVETLLFDYLVERTPVEDLVRHLEALGLTVRPLGAQ